MLWFLAIIIRDYVVVCVGIFYFAISGRYVVNC